MSPKAINNSKRGGGGGFSDNNTSTSHGNKSVLLFPDQLITVSPPDNFNDDKKKQQNKIKKPPRNANVLFANKYHYDDFESGYDRGRSFFPSEDFLDYLRERRRMEGGNNMMMDGKRNNKKRGSLGIRKENSAVSNVFRIVCRWMCNLGPLASGATAGLLYSDAGENQQYYHHGDFGVVKRCRDEIWEDRKWTVIMILLGGLFSSVLLFAHLHLLKSRTRLLAISTLAQLSSLALLATQSQVYSYTINITWLPKVAPFTCGAGLGLLLPIQHLLVAETASPQGRCHLGMLCHLLVWLGVLSSMLAHPFFGTVTVACTIIALLLIHFVTVAFLHPDTPRSLLLRGEKASCVKSLQWLRGPDADIGKEYEDLAGETGGEEVKATGNNNVLEAIFKRSFLQPLLISVTLTTLTSLCGLVTFSGILIGIKEEGETGSQDTEKGAQNLENGLENGWVNVKMRRQ